MIRFRINRDDPGMTWEEYETIELAQEGIVKLRLMRPLVARFMVDDQGAAIPHEQAVKMLGGLPMKEVRDVFTQFAKALTDTAIPNDNGRTLNSPSEATTPSASPDGSAP